MTRKSYSRRDKNLVKKNTSQNRSFTITIYSKMFKCQSISNFLKMANFAKVKCQFLKKNKRKEKANLVKKKKKWQLKYFGLINHIKNLI